VGSRSGQCASVRRHHRHRSPDTETVLVFALVRTPSGSIVDASRRDVTLAPIYSGQAPRKPSFGISHPCGSFDQWPAIPLVDHGHKSTGR
jgi:hypothetical protein